MTGKPIAIVTGLVLVVLLLLFSTTYTVKYNEIAIKTTFGKVTDASVVADPGLHFRLPIFVDKVHTLDTRLQLVESPLEEIETSDGLQLVVRAFLLWKVDDTTPGGALAFFERYASVENAGSLLESQFRTAFVGALSTYRFADLVGPESRLGDVEESIRSSLASALAGSGVAPVTVGISQVMFPPKTSRAVLERMKAFRDVIAQSENAKGTAEAGRIRAEASTKAEKIRAFATQRAEEIRAEGDLQSAKYLEQMSEDEELAVFLIWVDTLRRALGEQTTIILPTGQEPWHLIGEPEVGANAIPKPAGAEGG